MNLSQNAQANSIKLSVVGSLYRSSPHIAEFCQRAAAAAQAIAEDSYEIVLVNDGSPDDSLPVALSCAAQNAHIKVVDLSRNFGHHKAMMTGMAYARGERVFLIDVDLEESPEWMSEFLDQMTEQRCDVVFGVQKSRKGQRFERWSGSWFYVLFRLLTGLRLPKNIVTARMMSRRYVDALLEHDEREVFLAGIWHITGFRQQPHAVTKLSTSRTTYTLRRKVSLLVNSVTSFSNAPLVGIFYIGILISTLAAAYVLYLLINWMFLSSPAEGWTSVIASVWLLGGMIISFIGVVGIYLAKVYSETKRRPYTIVRSVYGGGTDE